MAKGWEFLWMPRAGPHNEFEDIWIGTDPFHLSYPVIPFWWGYCSAVSFRAYFMLSSETESWCLRRANFYSGVHRGADLPLHRFDRVPAAWAASFSTLQRFWAKSFILSIHLRVVRGGGHRETVFAYKGNFSLITRTGRLISARIQKLLRIEPHVDRRSLVMHSW